MDELLIKSLVAAETVFIEVMKKFITFKRLDLYNYNDTISLCVQLRMYTSTRHNCWYTCSMRIINIYKNVLQALTTCKKLTRTKGMVYETFILLLLLGVFCLFSLFSEIESDEQMLMEVEKILNENELRGTMRSYHIASVSNEQRNSIESAARSSNAERDNPYLLENSLEQQETTELSSINENNESFESQRISSEKIRRYIAKRKE